MSEALCKKIRTVIPWILIFMLIFYGQFRNRRIIYKHDIWIDNAISYLNDNNITSHKREKAIWQSFFNSNNNLNIPENFIPFSANLESSTVPPKIEGKK